MSSLDRRVKALEQSAPQAGRRSVFRYESPEGAFTYPNGDEPAPGEECDFTTIQFVRPGGEPHERED